MNHKILEYIQKQGLVSPKQLVDAFMVSSVYVHRVLKKLLSEGQLEKHGTSPKVYYSAVIKTEEKAIAVLDDVTAELSPLIEERFLKVSPVGGIERGVKGFVRWCAKRELPLIETAKAYLALHKKIDQRRTATGLLDATLKLQKTFTQTTLSKLFYIDFYSIERFGKTHLGELILYAKQSQDRQLMKEIATLVKPKIQAMIHDEKITHIGFIPPTMKRDVQFMVELEKFLQLSTPRIVITKLKNQVAVTQKSLSKLEDRIENAKKTLVVEARIPMKNILLIDDAVGSGATMNEVANQLQRRHLVTGKIIGVSLVGSQNGFDVINEV